MKRALALASALLLGATEAPPPAATPCAMTSADRGWIEASIAHWRVAERDLLKLAPRPLPTIIVVDARCTYTALAARGGWRWPGTPHGGTVRFANGVAQPVGPISFAAPDPTQPTGGFFAMSLPSVWRAAGITSGLGLERLMDGVMLHESMHARQFYFVNPTMAAFERRYGTETEASDDAVQARFKTDPAYVAAYEAERDTLFRAAAAPTDAQARALAGEALRLMRARRTRFFTGADAKWLQLDDLFLQMEGVGQWLAYAWYVSPRGAGLAPARVLPEVRRGGRFWTQDEGLALFLVVDRLSPGWQRDAFAAQPLLAEALLAKAAGVSAASPPSR